MNDPPVSVADSYSLSEGGTLSVTSANGVLSNDSDTDGNSLSAVKVSDPLHGTLSLNSNGSFTYTHNGSETTGDSFTYKANDGTTDGNTVTVTLTINPVNDPPVISDVNKAGQEDNIVSFSLADFSGSFTDPEGNTLSKIIINSLPSNGVLKFSTVNIQAGLEVLSELIGSITFTPASNWNGTTSFDWNGSDGALYASSSKKVNITIAAVNDPPVITDFSKTGSEDNVIGFTLSDFSTAFSDPDGNSLASVRILSLPANGTLRLSGSAVAAGEDISAANLGSLTFTPSSNWNGSTGFDWNASDGTVMAGASRSVNITVSPVNDPPVSVADSYSLSEGGTLSVTSANGVLSNDSDTDGNSLSAVKVSDPLHGTLSLNSNGAFTYSHNGSETTGDSFTYKANDGTTDGNTVTVTLIINPVNDPPVVSDVNKTGQEDNIVSFSLSDFSASFTDPEGNSLSKIIINSLPSNGVLKFSTVNIQAGLEVLSELIGSITFTPASNWNGTTSFDWNGSDGALYASSSKKVNITITGVNDPPVITDFSKTGSEDNILSFTLSDFSTAFSDADGNSLASVRILSLPANGTLRLSGSAVTAGEDITAANLGSLTFTPSSNWNGSTGFDWNASDGTVMAGASRRVNITVSSVNDPPVSVADSYTLSEGGTLSVTSANGVLSNDSDTDGNSLSAVKVSDPLHGTLSLNSNGAFTYSHNGSETTGDSFTYKANDGTTDGNTVTVTLTINPVNDPPVVSDVNKTGQEDNIVSFSLADFSGSFTDPEGNSLSKIIINSLPSNGVLKFSTVNIQAGLEVLSELIGSITFTPASNWNGTTSFDWNGSDGALYASSSKKVNITITGVNDPPVLSDFSKSGSEDNVIGFTLSDFSTAFSDADGNSLASVRILSLPANGTLRLSGSAVAAGEDISAANLGSLTFTPSSNWNGSTGFDWNASDGTVMAGASRSVNITVSPVNDPPVSVADSYSLSEGGTLSVTSANGVLSNDSDTDGNSLSAVKVSDPLHGTLSLNSNGAFTYSHNGSETTGDSFTYKANDGTTDGNTVTVTLTINPVNDPPVVSDVNKTGQEDNIVSFSLADFSGSFTDPEGNSLSKIIINSLPSNGVLKFSTVNIQAGLEVLSELIGSITFTPASNWNGTTSFDWNGSDGALYASSSKKVNITITGVNDPPVLSDFSKSGSEDNVIGFTLPDFTAAFSDPDGNPLAFVRILSLPANGTLRLSGSAVTAGADITAANLGSLTFTPSTNWNGSTGFDWNASDGTVLAATSRRVNITVSPVNDPPAVSDISKTIAEDNMLTFSMADFNNSFTDIDGNTLSKIRILNLPAHGILRLSNVAMNAGTEIPSAGISNITFVPELNWNGAVTFDWNGSDGSLYATTSGKYSISISPVNDPPVISDISRTGMEDTSVSFNLADFTAAFTDVDGNSLLKIRVITLPANGLLRLSDNALLAGAEIQSSDIGNLIFIPAADWNGSTSFDWNGSDGNLYAISTRQVNIRMNAVNDAPVIHDISKSGPEDTPLDFSFADFNSSFADVDGNPVSKIRIVSLPANGILRLSGIAITAGSEISSSNISNISFIPAPDWNGTTSFSYNGSDGFTYADLSAQIILNINSDNDPPVVTDISKSGTEDISVSFNSADFNSAFSDVDGNSLSRIRIVSLPSNGVLKLSGIAISAGTEISSSNIANLVFVPDINWNGITTFNWNGYDGALYANSAGRFNINISAVNDPPIISDIDKSGTEDAALTFTLADFAGAFSDVDGNPLSIIRILTLPENGKLKLSGVDLSPGTEIAASLLGNLTFTALPDWNGFTTFDWNGSDGTLYASLFRNVNININSTNDVPVAVADSYSLNEGATLSINTGGILMNDTDNEGSNLTAVKVSDPKHGTLTLNPDGSFIYSHDGSETTTDEFNYKAFDGTDSGNIATVNFIINPVNDSPVSVPDHYTLDEGGTLDVNSVSGILSNDSDAEGSALTAIKLTDPVHGILTLHSNGSFIYTHDSSESRIDSFTYKTNDGQTDGNIIKVFFAINPVNDSPVAVADNYSCAEEATLSIGAPSGLLANDTDSEGDQLSCLKVTDPGHGTLTLNSDGSFIYVNDGSESTEDHFTYQTSDGILKSSIVTVIISINAENDPPVAVADTYSLPEGGSLTVGAASGLLANDTDSEGSALTVEKVTNPSHGTLSLNTDGTFVYVHDGSETTVDSFNYRANDGALSGNIATVTFAVSPVNDPPNAAADAAIVNEDGKLEGASLITNDSDPEGNTLIISTIPVSGPSHGVLVINSNGSYTYTPELNFNGNDSFIYQICDNGSPSSCSSARVSITVTPVNDAPIAVSDEGSVNEHGVLNGISLLSNDSDPDGNSLTIDVKPVIAPSHGSLVINANGTYTYVPSAGYSGRDSFTYRICDNASPAACSIASVNIIINEVNDPPVTAADLAVLNEDEILQGSSLLVNDSDPEGNSLLIDTTPLSGPSHGDLVIHSNGTYTYTPFVNYNGSDSFTYRVCDNGVPPACSSAAVSLLINAVEDNPIATNDNFEAKENIEMTGNLLQNDSNPDSGNLSLNRVPSKLPVHGTVVILENGDFTYKPLIDFIGMDSFTYQIYNSDKPALNATAIVTIKVVKNNDCEVFVPNSFSPNGDGIHEFFKVRCLYNYANPSIEFYNRWGNLVYRKDHYGDKDFWGSDEEAWWDGNSDRKLSIGKELPAGTYYYVLTLEKGKVITGFLYLNR